MTIRSWFGAALIACLAACSPQAPVDGTAPGPAVEAPDIHTSRNSLDWAGTYEGVIACADCAGVLAALQLNQDGTYLWSTRRLAAGEPQTSQQGVFTWSDDGGSIALAADANAPGFRVGEGSLRVLEADGSTPSAGSGGALGLVPAERPEPAAFFEAHAWSLASATAADNSRIDALFPAEGAFALAFAGGRLNVSGGCNGLRAGYELGLDGKISIGQAAATMMACPEPLMAADAALGTLLAAPMEWALAHGPTPTLALMAATGEVLLFRGEQTPESRYGPATTVFFEVAAERAPCDGATSPDQLCLQTREISFDGQGLRVGEPGDFRPFAGEIQGYQHVEGVRNVIRVKQFQPREEGQQGVLMLDLVVESEKVAQ